MNASKFNLTTQQKALVQKEIRRQIKEVLDDYYKNSIAIYLYSLWMYEGWGKRKLKKFYIQFDELHQELLKHYQLDEKDDSWLCKTKLKNDLEVDVEEWVKGNMV